MKTQIAGQKQSISTSMNKPYSSYRQLLFILCVLTMFASHANAQWIDGGTKQTAYEEDVEIVKDNTTGGDLHLNMLNGDGGMAQSIRWNERGTTQTMNWFSLEYFGSNSVWNGGNEREDRFRFKSNDAGDIITIDANTGKVTFHHDVIFNGSGGGGSSLWTANGSNVYYNTGNVGIGINIPSQKLDVNGASYMRGNVSLMPGNGVGLRFWNSNSYKIHMGNAGENKYGPVTDYSIKMNMSNNAGRGWVWGVSGQTPIAALNTLGNMKIKGTFESESGVVVGAMKLTNNRELYLQSNPSYLTRIYDGNYGINFQSRQGNFRFYKGDVGAETLMMHLATDGSLDVSGNMTGNALRVKSSAGGDWHSSGVLMEVGNGSYNAIRGHDGAATMGTLHFFDDTWESGNINRSGGAVNLQGKKGVTIGGWSNPQIIADAGNSTVKVNSYLSNSGGAGIEIQGGQNGGTGRALYIWKQGDTNWGMYMGQPGAGRALNGTTAVAGYNFNSWAIRSRVANSSTSGFVWENGSNQLLMSLRGSDGSAYIKGDLNLGGKIIGDGSLLTGTQGNFGQFHPHSTYTDFNATVTDWGWNYVQGSTNGPNNISSQWYRFIGSLGSQYGINQYRIEIAYPRYNTATAGVWMRTMENGVLKPWVQINGGGGASLDNIISKDGQIYTLGAATNATAGISVRATVNPSAGKNLFTVEPSGEQARFGVTQSHGGWFRDGLRIGEQHNDVMPAMNNGLYVAGDVTFGQAIAKKKLTMHGDIVANRIAVASNPASFTAWPDYVFANDYELRPLEEVEAYIYAEQHLPEVPSAQEVATQGFDLGDMDATLLKKVEELTLYIIEQNKKLEAQNQRISELEARITDQK